MPHHLSPRHLLLPAALCLLGAAAQAGPRCGDEARFDQVLPNASQPDATVGARERTTPRTPDREVRRPEVKAPGTSDPEAARLSIRTARESPPWKSRCGSFSAGS